MSMSAATEQVMFDEMMRVRKRGKYSPHESNYTRLFGTPERAARTLDGLNKCDADPSFSCDGCTVGDACVLRYFDYDTMLEWLEGGAE